MGEAATRRNTSRERQLAETSAEQTTRNHKPHRGRPGEAETVGGGNGVSKQTRQTQQIILTPFLLPFLLLSSLGTRKQKR
jgi:hypothetical protein